ncbi:L-Ala-D/L-amino acid epimerase-like [Carica papaya]|uniref:L-Ala-D/L-amino acid epimerase-like n=1 Tax=Carica papaya TaxID=3649 RepID=UPI000B8CAF7C|nr:L-Ala-D/L-amino acid epimerase-like [Carica papaya]
MTPLGSALVPATCSFSFFFPSSAQKLPKSSQTHQQLPKICVAASSGDGQLLTSDEPAVAERTSFGLRSLIKTFWVDVERAEGRALNVKLNAAVGMEWEKVENVGVRVELSNGCVGWGEVAVPPDVNGSGNQATALVNVKEACDFLRQTSPMTLNLVLAEIDRILPGLQFASVRAGVEMALIDAIANSIDVPLWRLFGGFSNSISSAVTISAISPGKAIELASKYRLRGFNTFKLNMGSDINRDIEVFQAIKAAHPLCSFIFDANQAYISKQAIDVLDKLHEFGVLPVVFEQPVKRNDWKGLGEVSRIARNTYGVSVSADESCQNSNDVEKIIKEKLADVINIKLSKFGVLGALEIINLARKSNLNLMINSMIQTRLATGFAAHMAAGLGCFKYVNLDTPFLMAEDPVIGGYEVSGGVYKFVNSRGQGGFLNWNLDSC